MNKQTGLIAGTSLIFVASIISFAARFATSIIIARTLGPEFKGIYNLTLLSSGLVLIICNLGLNGAISYLVASRKYSSKQLFTLSVTAGLGLSISGAILFYLAYQHFFINNILKGSDPQLILWVMLGLPISLVTSFLSSLLLGQQRMMAYNLVLLINVLTNLAFQIISSMLYAGVSGAIIAWLASNFLGLILALWYLRTDFNLRVKPLVPVIRPALSYGARSYTANLLTFFNLRLDSFLVNAFKGAAEVGQYTSSVTFAEFLWYIPNAVSSALFPKVSSVDKDTANRITPQACRQTLLIVFVAAIAFSGVGGFLIVLLYGQAYRPAVLPFLLLLPGMIGVTVAKIISADLSGRGKPQIGAYTAGITIFVTVILDIVLIPLYSISGAAIASSVAYIASGALSLFWFSRETGTLPSTLLIPRSEDFRYLLGRSITLAQRSMRYVVNRKGNDK
jgi:O-antigen/teichoic acid export membrane protein